MAANTNREIILDNWLQQVLNTQDYQRANLAGDASFRRYYRVWVADKPYVVMDAPPPEAPELFVNISLILNKEALCVPKVIAQDLSQGFLLLSDLGDRIFLKELNSETADPLYQLAIQAMLKFQKCQAEVPVFDRAFLKRQMGIFEEWFLKKHKGMTMNEALQNQLAPVYEQIFQIIESQPQVFVHRDYHSRNLMIINQNTPGILDFQDAMQGPITYDLVSLLQDCYISWPRERVIGWVADYQDRALQLGLLNPEITNTEFLRWFDWTGIQRHLKNLGIFARLHHRDNKSGYLKDIPQLLTYIAEAVERYAELKPLRFLVDTIPEAVVE